MVIYIKVRLADGIQSTMNVFLTLMKYFKFFYFKQQKFLISCLKIQIEEKLDSTGKKIKVSIESGHQVEKITEENYMFRLSEFTNKLKEYFNKNVVIPQKYQNTLWTQIENLTDLSVSREYKRVHWGIPVNKSLNYSYL